MDVKIAEEMFDATVSIAGIWPFPAYQADELFLRAMEYADEMPAGLEDLIKGWEPEEIENLYDGDSSEAVEAWEEVFATGHRKSLTGFICKAWCPVYSASGGFSWGHKRSNIVFASTAEEAIKKQCDWANAQYQAAKSVPA